MDTIETYKKMMSGAWADLKDDMPIDSCIFSRRLRMLYILDGKVVMWREKVNTSNYYRAIPLLEQDQLQAMLDVECIGFSKAECLIFEMVRYLQDISVAYGKGIPRHYNKEGMLDLEKTSMEQLWLAFVMSELYRKKWLNEEWILSQS